MTVVAYAEWLDKEVVRLATENAELKQKNEHLEKENAELLDQLGEYMSEDW